MSFFTYACLYLPYWGALCFLTWLFVNNSGDFRYLLKTYLYVFVLGLVCAAIMSTVWELLIDLTNPTDIPTSVDALADPSTPQSPSNLAWLVGLRTFIGDLLKFVIVFLFTVKMGDSRLDVAAPSRRS